MSWRASKWARKQRVGSQTAKAVLICQAHHADDNGLCWPSQETMAAEIESSVDSVQRALKKVLVPTFVHRIKRKSSDGRRISDAYQLRVDREPEEAQSNPCGPAPCGPVDGVHQAAESISTKPQTEASPGRTLRHKSIEEKIQESSCRLLRDTPGGARLEKRLGKGVFDSWFAKVSFVEERDHLLVLQAPNRHVANTIEQWYDADVIHCFQPEYKRAVRVKVILRKDTSP